MFRFQAPASGADLRHCHGRSIIYVQRRFHKYAHCGRKVFPFLLRIDAARLEPLALNQRGGTQKTLDQFITPHFKREKRHCFPRGRKAHILCHIKNNRRFPHRRACRDNNQIPFWKPFVNASNLANPVASPVISS